MQTNAQKNRCSSMHNMVTEELGIIKLGDWISQYFPDPPSVLYTEKQMKFIQRTWFDIFTSLLRPNTYIAIAI